MNRIALHRLAAAALLLAAGLAPALLAPSLAADPAPDTPVPDRLDLKGAIGFALQNNFDIRLARERIRQQDGVILQVRAQGIPTVSAAALYQENSAAISQTYPASTSDWNGSVTANQVLYAGGSIRSSIRGASLDRQAALLDLEGTINGALLEVRTRYYNVLLARDKIKVQEQAIALLEAQLADATNRFEAGSISSFDKLRAQVALANGRVPLITARSDFRIAVEQLRQSLGFANRSGQNAQKVPEFLGDLAYGPTQFELTDCLEAAHANRPELLRLAKMQESAEQGITTARSGYLPNLSLNGGWQIAKTEIAFGPGPASVNGWRLGLQSQWAIFDGRATAGRLVQARSQAQQARLSLDEESLEIDVEVRQAYSAWEEAVELASATEKTVEQAEESLRLATARYDAGSATQLDVQQTQVDLTQARTNLLQANYTYAVSVAQLREAMGVADDYRIQ